MLRLDRITFNPHVMGGRTCVHGMRVTVAGIKSEILHLIDKL